MRLSDYLGFVLPVVMGVEAQFSNAPGREKKAYALGAILSVMRGFGVPIYGRTVGQVGNVIDNVVAAFNVNETAEEPVAHVHRVKPEDAKQDPDADVQEVSAPSLRLFNKPKATKPKATKKRATKKKATKKKATKK